MENSESQARSWLAEIRTMVRKLDPQTAAIDGLAELSRQDMVKFLTDQDVEFPAEAPDDVIRKLIADGIEDGTVEPDYSEHNADEARDRIAESALEVTYRSGWVAPGDDMEPEEFNILLCTGGPAVRIIGRLNCGMIEDAHLEHQDWGTPWTKLQTTSEEDELIAQFCSNIIVE